MRIPDYRPSGISVFIAVVVAIFGAAILTAPVVSPAQNGASIRILVHRVNAFPAAARPAGRQDAGQTTPSAAAAAAPKPVDLPDGDGKPIATEYCQACHKLTNLTKAHKTEDDWKDTVQTMVDRGAQIPDDKIDTLVKYLAKNFGPATAASAGSAPAAVAPPAAANATSSAPVAAKPVELPDGDGKAIATENCQACHKLTNLTKAHKSLDEWKDTVQTMIDRGANVPTDKIDTLVQYLAKNFGAKDAAAPTGGAPGSSTQSQ